ncbi:MAG: hypothetical protein ABIQ39_04070, partial [Ilumatobacteraceae bacterium]
MLIYGVALEAAPGKSGVLAPQVGAIRDACADATGQPWCAWVAVAGRPFGSYLLSTRHDNMAQLITGSQKVAASSTFQGLSAGLSGVLAHPAEPSL